ATTMIYTSGIIHFADSKEMFDSLPKNVKELFIEMPSTWDDTESIFAYPGDIIVLYRRKGDFSYIVGINGKDEESKIKIDLRKYSNGFSKFRLFSEGENPLMDFETEI